MTVYEIEMSELQKYVNPLDGNLWKCGTLLEEEILSAKLAGARETRSWEGDDVVRTIKDQEQAREFHINRIATLMDEPLDEILKLVVISHIKPMEFFVHDGNHRLAAAYVRGDKTIKLQVIAPDLDNVSDVFPTAKFLY